MIEIQELNNKISAHLATRLPTLWKQRRYVEGRNPSILQPSPKEEPDNRIPVPFARRAVSTIVGYMGKEGAITYSGEGYTEALQDTLDENDEGLENAELLLTGCSHGTAYELHWTVDGADQFAQVPIDQAIPIYSNSLRPMMVGFIRYWSEATYDYCEYYDDKEINFLSREKGKQEWTLDDTVAHAYGRVPIIEFRISKDRANVFDHVTALIDWHDKIISEDYANELARFASSYLLMSGQIDSETEDENGETEAEKIKRTKIFERLGSERAVTDAIAFLTKNVNDAFIGSAADRGERLIYEMLSLFNPNDEDFATASGVAQKYKLLGFEYLCTNIATYFSIGLQDRIALIQGLNRNMSGKLDTILRFFGLKKENTDVSIQWRRNLPDDLELIATMAAQLNGIISKRSILRLFPSNIVENIDKELAAIEEEEPEIIENVEEEEVNANA